MFSKNMQISNFIKIRQVGADLFHADGQTDGQTDMMCLVIAFRKFAKVPSKQSGCMPCHILPTMPQPKCGFLLPIWWLISQLRHLHVRHNTGSNLSPKTREFYLKISRGFPHLPPPPLEADTKIVSEAISVPCTPCSIPFLETFRHSNAVEPDVPTAR